ENPTAAGDPASRQLHVAPVGSQGHILYNSGRTIQPKGESFTRRVQMIRRIDERHAARSAQISRCQNFQSPAHPARATEIVPCRWHAFSTHARPVAPHGLKTRATETAACFLHH